MPSLPLLYSTLLYSTLLYSTLLYSTLLYATLHTTWGWAYIDGRKWLNRGVETNRDLHFGADQDGPAADALEVSDCGQYLAREAQCSGKRWLRLVLPTRHWLQGSRSS